jgi:uncharacterized phage protein gp47/JayE
MQLNLLTKDQIVSAMGAAVQSAASAAGLTIPLAEGSPILAILNAVAGAYLWLQWLALKVLSAARLSTSTGADVDTFVNQFGCYRLAGAGASGMATFSRYLTTSSAIIPVGTIVKTTDGTQSFTVLADSTNAAWMGTSTNYPNGYFQIAAGVASLAVTVQNTVAGTAGNVLAGAIGLIASVLPGVDTVTNAAAFTNGLNAESDAALQARFGLYLPALAKATPVAMESAVLAVSQNLTCAVLNNVMTIGGAEASGFFVVAVDDGSGATPSATLSAVGSAVAATQALGTTGFTVQATVIIATVVLTIQCASSVLHAATVPLVQAAIQNFIAALPVATSSNAAGLPYWRLGQLAFDASPNVQSVSGVLLNGGTSDIGGTPGTVVRLGSVTVN